MTPPSSHLACTVPCNLCGGTDVDLARSKDRDGQPLQTVICKRCGLVWVDAVTTFHVVEHLESPFDLMARARQWLKPGGILLVEVPSVEATCQQPHSQFHPGHLYHFNLVTLRAMHRRAGFEVCDSSTSPDGGNLIVISKCTEQPALTGEQAAALCEGNYRRVATILQRHTSLRHALTLHPLTRPIHKMIQRIDESRAVRTGRAAREQLDHLIQTRMGVT